MLVYQECSVIFHQENINLNSIVCLKFHSQELRNLGERSQHLGLRIITEGSKQSDAMPVSLFPQLRAVQYGDASLVVQAEDLKISTRPMFLPSGQLPRTESE